MFHLISERFPFQVDLIAKENDTEVGLNDSKYDAKYY